uniref:NADH-ubiquinone oxidoreductase chain 2 n=1 Tax=Aegorhinus superciliosus TaxID=1448030 RepID=A0A0K0KA44_9CUCU|nr:NADH dehydrogenase subunit 2 [Aegorhinus superciliosus]AHG32661.1 NADH dehydrogenase subunit 2 [Aegorhinus superciliosus]
MLNNYKILFISSLAMGTMITISAYSWLIAWIGLEINLLSFIPLMKKYKNMFPAETTLKYFIVQTMASSFLLLTLIMCLNSKNPLENFNTTQAIMISSALLMKMGAAPFHFWLPEVMSGLKWTNIFILSTWQKIAPMILISYQIKTYILFFSIIIILSSMISSFQGMNQIDLRKIMAYSSINHISWMLSSLLNSINIWMYYFLIYCFINLNIMLIFKNMMFFINQLINLFTFNKNMKFFMYLNFLSLGGLPPFLGFFPKWLTISNMVENNHYFLSSMLIIFSLISLYFYTRITLSSFTINLEESLIISLNKINYFHLMTNTFSLLGLILCSYLNM